MTTLNDIVDPNLGDVVICDRCGATLDSYVDACTADLDDACPGFKTIEQALPPMMRRAS